MSLVCFGRIYLLLARELRENQFCETNKGIEANLKFSFQTWKVILIIPYLYRGKVKYCLQIQSSKSCKSFKQICRDISMLQLPLSEAPYCIEKLKFGRLIAKLWLCSTICGREAPYCSGETIICSAHCGLGQQISLHQIVPNDCYI